MARETQGGRRAAHSKFRRQYSFAAHSLVATLAAVAPPLLARDVRDLQLATHPLAAAARAVGAVHMPDERRAQAALQNLAERSRHRASVCRQDAQRAAPGAVTKMR